MKGRIDEQIDCLTILTWQSCWRSVVKACILSFLSVAFFACMLSCVFACLCLSLCFDRYVNIVLLLLFSVVFSSFLKFLCKYFISLKSSKVFFIKLHITFPNVPHRLLSLPFSPHMFAQVFACLSSS